MKVTQLPADLRVIVLSHLDFGSLARVVRSHSSFNSIWKTYPEHLCRAISIRNGLADAQTVGAAAPLLAEGWHERGGLDNEPSLEELRDVIRQQRSLGGAFDQVASWTEYAKTRCRIDRNWKYGTHKKTEVYLDLGSAMRYGLSHDEIWRFKIDPVSGWVLATGLLEGVWAFDTQGQLVWHSVNTSTPYGHIELTYNEGTSFFCTMLNSRLFVIWRFHDPTKLDDPDARPPSMEIPAHVTALLAGRFGSLDSNRRGYHPFACLIMPEHCSASKLRFPVLLTAAVSGAHLWAWRFTESNRAEMCTIDRILHGDGTDEDDGEQDIHYLELDESNLFIGGLRSVRLLHGLTMMRGRDDLDHVCWPPRPPRDYTSLEFLVPRPLYFANEDRLRPVAAVHHDSKSRFLVGATMVDAGPDDVYGEGFAVLSITYRYSSALWKSKSTDESEREEIEQRTLNLRFDNVLGIGPLSVENDRAAFVVSSNVGSALFVVPLVSFESLAEFAADPPRPILLDFPLPVSAEPSRIESDSTAIFLPTHASRLPEPAYHSFDVMLYTWEDAGLEFPFPMKWQTLDGQTLVDYEREGRTMEKGSTEWKSLDALNADVVASRASIGCSTLAKYSFDVA